MNDKISDEGHEFAGRVPSGGWYVFTQSEREIKQIGGYWRVCELVDGCVVRMGKGHRFRWAAKLELRRAKPGYWPGEAMSKDEAYRKIGARPTETEETPT